MLYTLGISVQINSLTKHYKMDTKMNINEVVGEVVGKVVREVTYTRVRAMNHKMPDQRFYSKDCSYTVSHTTGVHKIHERQA